MNTLFDKSVLSFSSLFVITLTIYILFSDNDDYDTAEDEDEDDIERFSVFQDKKEENENDPFKEYGTFYGTRNITEGFSFTGGDEEDETVIEGMSARDWFRKTFDKKNIERAFTDLGHDIKGGIDKAGREIKGGLEKVKTGLEKAGDDIKNGLLAPLKPLIEFFQKIDRFFKSIPCRIKHFNSGFKEFGIGLKMQFDNLGKGLKLGFSDIFSLIGTLGTCGIHFIKNLGNCIFYYILEMIGHIIYTIFFVFPMYVIKSITGADMMSYVEQLWKLFYYFDRLLYSMTKMHFMHYPDSIVQQCYTCNFMDKVVKINEDWNHTIPKLLNEPICHFKRSGKHFQSVVKSPKSIREDDEEAAKAKS